MQGDYNTNRKSAGSGGNIKKQEEYNMTLEEIRLGIDKVDAGIKQAFMERMGYAAQIAEVKAKTGDEVYKPERENVIFDKLTVGVAPDLKREYKALIKRIMELSRKYQYGKMVSQGVADPRVLFPTKKAPSPEHNRIRIRFECNNECGAFAKVLTMIADYGVNVSEIYTIKREEPAKHGVKFVYVFVLELDATLFDREIQVLMYQLSKETRAFEILETFFCDEATEGEIYEDGSM